MPKYKTKFSLKLKATYPFLSVDPKDECDEICTVCKTSISVANKGKAGIEIHINSTSHKKAIQAPIENRSVTQFFPSVSGDNVSFKVAAEELGFTFHAAKHGLSLPAADCNSLLVNLILEPKFRSGKTKTAAIFKNVSKILYLSVDKK